MQGEKDLAALEDGGRGGEQRDVKGFHKLEKSKKWIFLRASRKAFILAQWDPLKTSDFQNCNIICLYCLSH